MYFIFLECTVEVAAMKNQIKIMKMLENLTELLAQKQNTEIMTVPPNIPVSLPISSMAEFEEFEIFLQNGDTMHKMVCVSLYF